MKLKRLAFIVVVSALCKVKINLKVISRYKTNKLILKTVPSKLYHIENLMNRGYEHLHLDLCRLQIQLQSNLS